MKRRIILLAFAASVAALAMQSSKTTTDLLTQRVTYTVTNQDNEGRTDQDKFNVEYDKFIIQYTADSGCIVINNSDSMMYIDMGESYFTSMGEAYPLYDNTVRTSSNSTTVGTSKGTVSTSTYYNTSFGKTKTVEKTNTNTTQTKEERIITIPPYSRRQIKFFYLGTPSIIEVVNGKEQFKKVGSVYNYTNEYVDVSGHTMTYTFTPQAYKKMARNNFTLTKEEILSTPAPVQKNSVGQRTVEGASHKVPSAGFLITFFGLVIAGGVILGVTM